MSPASAQLPIYTAQTLESSLRTSIAGISAQGSQEIDQLLQSDAWILSSPLKGPPPSPVVERPHTPIGRAVGMIVSSPLSPPPALDQKEKELRDHEAQQICKHFEKLERDTNKAIEQTRKAEQRKEQLRLKQEKAGEKKRLMEEKRQLTEGLKEEKRQLTERKKQFAERLKEEKKLLAEEKKASQLRDDGMRTPR
jgi:DNA repair exonuclease SbcCD ATPase subunit